MLAEQVERGLDHPALGCTRRRGDIGAVERRDDCRAVFRIEIEERTKTSLAARVAEDALPVAVPDEEGEAHPLLRTGFVTLGHWLHRLPHLLEARPLEDDVVSLPRHPGQQ